MSYIIDGKTYCKHGHERTKKNVNKYGACKVCHNEKFNTPGKVRRQNYARYGLTEQEVQAMFAAQKGVCASCGNPETAIVKRTGKPKMLHIDHDHETGTVRALLCQDCNIALGHLRHNSKRIQALFSYAVGHGL